MPFILYATYLDHLCICARIFSEDFQPFLTNSSPILPADHYPIITPNVKRPPHQDALGHPSPRSTDTWGTWISGSADLQHLIIG